jgi:hypothetical protein
LSDQKVKKLTEENSVLDNMNLIGGA